MNKLESCLISTRLFWDRLNKWIKRGILLLAIGSTPLLIAIGLDALGIIDGGTFLLFGLIVFLTFWPGIVMIIFGIFTQIVKHFRKK
jgi:hypothetical protein